MTLAFPILSAICDGPLAVSTFMTLIIAGTKASLVEPFQRVRSPATRSSGATPMLVNVLPPRFAVPRGLQPFRVYHKLTSTCTW